MTRPRFWTREPDLRYAAHISGTLFQWIERIDSPKFDQVRRDIESLWISAPESMRSEFLKRLRSGRPSNVHSAFCELWFRDVLAGSGFTCLNPKDFEPPSTADWILKVSGRSVAAVECYVRTESDEDARIDRVKQLWFHTTRSKMTDKSLHLDVEEVIAGPGQPSARHFAKHLDEIGKTVLEPGPDTNWSQGAEQVYEHEESGWAVRFSPGRIRYSNHQPARSLVGSELVTDDWNVPTPLAAAIAKKSRQYDCSLPLVLCFHWHTIDSAFNFDEVRRIVADRSTSMQAKGVYGLLWAPMVFPWGSDLVGGPTLLHWNAPELAPFLDVWSGATEDVSPLISD